MAAAQKLSIGDDELEALVSALEVRWRDGQMLLRAYPREATIRGQCRACGLERVETVERLGYEAFIRKYDRSDTLFFLDPPYWNCETDTARECSAAMTLRLLRAS